MQDQSYGYDLIGKLIWRNELNTGLNEVFTYDGLNRLTQSKVNQSTAKLFAFSPTGNMLSKSDVGSYIYGDSTKPHALTAINPVGGGSSINFTYDANGNQLSSSGTNGVAYQYTSYDKPWFIQRGSNYSTFLHDDQHQRWYQARSDGSATITFADAGVMAELTFLAGGGWQWTNYLTGGSEVIGINVQHHTAGTSTQYFHKDHLGSIATITNGNGAVVERLSYDPWGKRRNADGSDDAASAITSVSSRGFTGHEMLDNVDIVHMNGRTYDPMLGRFAQADPVTEAPFSTQGWNRYAYVGNSPVNFTDPSGYCFMGCFWKGAFKAIGNLLRKFPVIGTILKIAVAVLVCGPNAPMCAGIMSSLTSAFVAGVSSGNLGAGLRAGLISAVTAFAFYGVGELTPGGHQPAFGTPAHIFNIAGHAGVGCVSAIASGGKCGPGALSAAAGSIASPFMETGSYAGNVTAHAVVGGLASVAGGGKFMDGAATAAFGYMFNNGGGPGQGHNGGPPMDDGAAKTEQFPSWSRLLRLMPVAAFLELSISYPTDFEIGILGQGDLKSFRNELGLPEGKGTIARLDVGGQSFWGINGHGQETSLRANAYSVTHAEGDVFQQALNQGIKGGEGRLFVDRPLCDACGPNMGVRSMVRQLGLSGVRVYTPGQPSYMIRP